MDISNIFIEINKNTVPKVNEYFSFNSPNSDENRKHFFDEVNVDLLIDVLLLAKVKDFYDLRMNLLASDYFDLIFYEEYYIEYISKFVKGLEDIYSSKLDMNNEKIRPPKITIYYKGF